MYRFKHLYYDGCYKGVIILDKRTKAKLTQKAVQGDTQAFSQLYAQIYKQLYYYALCNLRNSEDAADAVQDAVLDGFTEISTLKNHTAFDSWMFRILASKIKQKQREYAQHTESLEDADIQNAVISETTEYEQCEIAEEFANLTKSERLCITLNCIAGYKGEEIEEITGINNSTVRSHISRGRSKIKRRLRL